MQLKKLSDDHYMVVTDEPIKEGDWFYDTVLGIVCQTDEHTNYEYANNSILIKKITHSTQPLEDVDVERLVGFNLTEKGYDKIKPLNLSTCKSLVGEVDIEKRIYDTDFRGDTNSYKQGYIQAIEDNKDKRFSEEDMRKAIEMARTKECSKDVFGESILMYKFLWEEIISSLTQPKDTWEVYFDENNNLKLK